MSDNSDDDAMAFGGAVDEDGDDGFKEEEDEETVGEKKMRMAKELLKKLTDASKREEEDDEDEDDEEAGGRRVAEILQRRQLEESGRKRWELAARSALVPFVSEVFPSVCFYVVSISVLTFSTWMLSTMRYNLPGDCFQVAREPQSVVWNRRKGASFGPGQELE